MSNQLRTYIHGNSPMHVLDARVKLCALPVLSIAIMAAPTWITLGVCAGIVLACAIVSRVHPSLYLKLLIPAFVFSLMAIVFSLFSFSVDGLIGGLQTATRIIALFLASLVVSLTTPETQIVKAFTLTLSPLKHLGVPVKDIATVASLTLRFIPEMATELQTIRAAQASRGAAFEDAGIIAKLSAWSKAFAALFVSMFRRADTLAQAMDARCYGKSEN